MKQKKRARIIKNGFLILLKISGAAFITGILYFIWGGDAIHYYQNEWGFILSGTTLQFKFLVTSILVFVLSLMAYLIIDD